VHRKLPSPPPPTSLKIPAAVKAGSAAFLLLVAVVYWRDYGPSNFLWLSDLGLACTVLAIIFENRFLASMAAVGVLALEIAWTVDFLTGGSVLGLAAYMFDSTLPLYLRGLSLFHIAVPAALVFLLHRYGYDRRALIWQSLLAFIALTLAYAFTDPEKNINWVFGPGEKPQHAIPPLLYLAAELVVIIGLVYPLTHFLLRRLFPQEARG
jgi:hypothetical protein